MVFLIFLTRLHHSPPPSQLLPPHDHQIWPESRPTAVFSLNRTPILSRRIHTNNRRWDSNAETFRTQKFDFNDYDDDFEEDDDEDEDTNQWLDILEDFIDGVWIFKVFRSFGWMLPAIISSLLLTSGPKAFLMALAIPLSQSVLSFVFQTVWGRPKNRTKSRGKSKRRSPSPPPPPRRSASSVDIDDEQEDKYTRRERKRAANGYQTWVAGDGGSGDEKANGSPSSFGGWEELDRKAGSKSNNSDRKRKTSKSTLSRRERKSQTPLFLRLLIAVFPFLGSWTRLL